jgi:hypothetical protein
MDRHSDRRMVALKKWRTGRAADLAMDPGVLCPNSGLEAIALRAPEVVGDLEALPELKGWFLREFGGEVVKVTLEAEPAETADENDSQGAKTATGSTQTGSSNPGSPKGGSGRRSDR